MSSWKVWLNIYPTSPSPSPTSSLASFHQRKPRQIGKNTWYDGPLENIWQTESISIIGYVRIYNEASLWELCPKTNPPPHPHHPMEIVVELYKIYGFETTLDYLDGDFAFVLMDYNIFGEEARLYVAKDPFGIFPLYKLESPDTSCKKVQFVPLDQNPVSEFAENTTIAEMKASSLYIDIPTFGSPHSGYNCNLYGFSSESIELENTSVEIMPNGTYDTFVHSYKVSATWKRANSENRFFYLPFQSTYTWKKSGFSPPNIENRIQDQMVVAVQKRIEWIRNCKKNSMDLDLDMDKKKMGVLHLIDNKKRIRIHPFLSFSFFFSLLETDFVKVDLPLIFSHEESTYHLEEKYPTVLQEIKMKIQSNDPGIIRAHFIPAIVAKTIVEEYPEVGIIWMGEAFTYEYLEMNMFERRKWIRNVYFLEKVKAWTETFLAYGLDLYMPFLDRMLVQTPDQYSRV
jgi:hypothetical protein